MTALAAYRAIALQTTCFAVNAAPDVAAARAKIKANITRIGAQIRAAKAFVGLDVKLVVLPEYFATSFPMGDAIPDWGRKAAFEIDGPEYQQLGQIAQDNAIHLSGNAYELDRHFPGIYFQTSFVIDDGGRVVLRYRRLVSLFAPTPHDVLERYLDVHGPKSLFPVADTPLGRLACIASEEILYPEIARCLALNGAEILLHSTSEVGSPQLTPKDICKRARAVENLCYVISANSARIDDLAFPAASTDGMSKIIDDEGRVLAEAGYGESMVASATIELAALRRRRLRPGMAHTLSRLPLELFHPSYARSIDGANSMLDGPDKLRIPARGEFAERQRAIIEQLVAAGVLSRD
jgi:predicted amidohydrolase